MKDFTNKKCCLTCDGFCWWDGDYCCTQEMKIHQYGYPNGIWFDENIDKTMKTPDNCKLYRYRHHQAYPESDNEFIEEYKKFKEWEKLKEQYYKQIK